MTVGLSASRRDTREWWFVAASLLVYAVLVFDHPSRFPLYFFCDEAVVGVDAKAILEHGRDRFGAHWPVFFQGLGDYALSLSVYWAMPFVHVLGLSENAVRIATGAASFIGVLSAYGAAAA